MLKIKHTVVIKFFVSDILAPVKIHSKLEDVYEYGLIRCTQNVKTLIDFIFDSHDYRHTVFHYLNVVSFVDLLVDCEYSENVRDRISLWKAHGGADTYEVVTDQTSF